MFNSDESAPRAELEDHVKVERSRITLLTGGAALALALATGVTTRARSEALPEVTVYRSPN